MLGDATNGLFCSSCGWVSHVLIFFTMKFFIVPKTNQNLHHSIIFYLCTYTTHTNKQEVKKIVWLQIVYNNGHSSDILSIRFKHMRILRIFGLLKKYFKILYTKANFQTFVFL